MSNNVDHYRELRREAADKFARHNDRAARIAVKRARQCWATLTPAERRFIVQGDNALRGYTLDDFRNAPGGIGPLAAEWRDKPHRLVYDLCQRLEMAALDTPEKSLPAA